MGGKTADDGETTSKGKAPSPASPAKRGQEVGEGKDLCRCQFDSGPDEQVVSLTAWYDQIILLICCYV